MRAAVALDEVTFQSVLGRVRELRHLIELTRSSARAHANIRARLHWHPEPPSLPPRDRKLADEIVELLGNSRLSSWQAAQLERAFFSGK